jgi:hypothetical protein
MQFFRGPGRRHGTSLVSGDDPAEQQSFAKAKVLTIAEPDLQEEI